MIQLHITYDSVDIDLQAGGYTVLDGFYPRSGRQEGERLTEDFGVYFRGTAAQRIAAERAINLAFEHARRSEEGASPVYLEFAVDGSESRWRAQVFDGLATLDSRMASRWKSGALRMQVAVEREGAWDGTETAVPISNSNGTNVTSGLTVQNDNFTGHSNYMAVAGTVVEGDLPGKTRLEMVYTPGGAYLMRDIWLGQSWHAPANLVHAYAMDGGTPYSIPSQTTPTVLESLSLSAASVNAMAGQVVKGLIRRHLSTLSYDITYQMRLKSGSFTIFEGPAVRTNTAVAYGVRDIGSIRIPPVPYTDGSLDGLTLELAAWQTTGSTVAIYLRDFYLMPMDGFRYLALLKQVNTSERVIDDGIKGKTYQDNGAGANRLAAAGQVGEPIRLYPGKDQRIYFLSHTGTANIPGVDDVVVCKLYYRPRRMGL